MKQQQKYKQTRYIDTNINKQANRHTGHRLTENPTHRQTDIQTEGQIILEDVRRHLRPKK